MLKKIALVLLIAAPSIAYLYLVSQPNSAAEQHKQTISNSVDNVSEQAPTNDKTVEK